MATRFNIPASPKRSTLEIDNFLGVDLTNTGSNVQESRSPNAPNMIRDVPGKVRKRMGYAVDYKFDKCIYGVHLIDSPRSAKVIEQNMCSSRSLEDYVLGRYSEFYIYSQNMLPRGTKVHVQFYVKTPGRLTIRPYVTNVEAKEITIEKSEDWYEFYADFDIDEPTNAFVIRNASVSEITFSIENMMIYFIDDDYEPHFNYKYSNYVRVDETSLYDISEPVKQRDDYYDGLKNGDTVGFFLNSSRSNRIYGTVGLQFHLALSELPEKFTFKSIDVKTWATYFNVEIETDLQPTYTVYKYSEKGWDIELVIDPAQLYEKGDKIEGYFLSQLLVTLNIDTGKDTFRVDLTDCYLYPMTLKAQMSLDDTIKLVHSGNRLWLGTSGKYSPIYNGMNMATSRSWQNENLVYIIDGENLYKFDVEEETFDVVSESGDAYIPTFSISRMPEGGGVAYEDLNLLSPGFIETFVVDEDHAEAKEFQLSFSGLDEGRPIKVELLSGDGEWYELEESAYEVVLSTGIVRFVDAPGETPLTGEDNVRITAYRTVEGYADRINKCTIGTRFGVNGAVDRLFLSGNPEYKNYDWHSGQYQFDYFPDTGYAKLGSDNSAIMGYTIVNNYLATHKDENDPQQSVIIREGDLVSVEQTTDEDNPIYDEKPAFKIINTLQGPGAIAKGSFQTLLNEPLFLTQSGVHAITASDVTGEKYSQLRSFYVNGALLDERNLENAISVVYNDMYFLFVNNKVYVLDGLQATQTDKQAPYATRQYAAFLLTGISASAVWVIDRVLWFGTDDGKICKVHTNKHALSSYSDEGKPIPAWWETADLDGNLFYKKKTFRYMAIRLKAAARTRCVMYSHVHGIWTKIKESKELSNIVFQFSTIDFEDFTFNTDDTDPVISSKIRVKKVDKAKFKVESPTTYINKYGEEVDNIEPFGLQNLAFEYVESGNYKG